PGRLLSTLWFNAWGFDWLYERLWVKPYLLGTRLLGKDPLDWMMNLPAWLAQRGHQLLVWTVSGKLRWYAASMGMGATLILALLLLG
ncbi:MAG: NADH-quinone oxidoreductase subunit L, partial [Aeromonas salmonicida]